MLRSLVGFAVTGLLLATSAVPAAAQNVWLDISWGAPGVRAGVAVRSGGVRVVGRANMYRRPAPPVRRIEQRHYAECVADGPYLYCWDAPRVYRGRVLVPVRPVVRVYVTDRAVARRYHPDARGLWGRAYMRQHEVAATRFWRRWADAHRYRYDRDRFMVDVALSW